MVFKFFACLILEKNQYKVFACFFENKLLFRLSFDLIGQFFLVYIYSRLSEQFQNHWRVSEQFLKAQAAIRKPEQAP
jgi:hypothetical protein